MQPLLPQFYILSPPTETLSLLTITCTAIYKYNYTAYVYVNLYTCMNIIRQQETNGITHPHTIIMGSEQNGPVDNIGGHVGQCVSEKEVKAGRKPPANTTADPKQTGSLYLKYLPFLFLCLTFLHYNFILTSKDICTAFDYCCISVNFGVITVEIEN